MNETIIISLTLKKTDERRYITIPFDVPDGIERLDVAYDYPRFSQAEQDGFRLQGNFCTIDLALLGPDGELIGASGSDRSHVWVSPLGSAEGFAQADVAPGQWAILAGAYQVPEGGVAVEYTVTMMKKHRRLFRGDTHVHTTASDGSADVPGLLGLAQELGLDFLCLTDHNNTAQNRYVGGAQDITILPGCEWTHYNGHAGLLGVEKPFAGTYVTNDKAETAAFLRTAQARGAMTIINHPFCSLVPWTWGFDVPFDAMEVWNGVMSERNERAVGWWHAQLVQGKEVPVTGGSDYHRPSLLGSLAMPCQFVYAPSRAPGDIMDALRGGRGFIAYLPGGPTVDMTCALPDGSIATMGDSVPMGRPIDIALDGLAGGDEIRLLTATDVERITCPEGAASLRLTRKFSVTPFARVEVYRSYAMGLPPMKALLSSPIYFYIKA